MKKFYFSFAVLSLLAVWCVSGPDALAQDERFAVASVDTKLLLISPNLVISQFQPGTTAVPNDEFVEIHNRSSTAVDLNGYRVNYRSATGSNDVPVPFAVWTTQTILQPGQFYLIASTSYTGSATPDITYNPTTCQCSMSTGQGGLAIRQGANDTGAIIDAVGWGTATNIFFEGTRTSAPGSGNSKVRLQNGCQDTDNNFNDFATLTPFAPRNRATTPVICSGSGSNLFASMSANPTALNPGSSTRLTVTVTPATTPPSTNITVVGNLATIGGSGMQPFFDDGVNGGDVTAGDNVFTYTATIPSGTAPGTYNVTGTASDGQGRTANTIQNLIVLAVNDPNENPLLFGNPSFATNNVANENNYLMEKPQYTLSYNRSKATANWVAWRLDRSWIGSSDRQDDFRPDDTLPAGWYRVTAEDYSEPVYDRGHMTPSGDRTRSVPDNSATFLMTNIVPQIPANNQGPWADLEVYCRTLADQGNEMYIISGPTGNVGTIGQTSNRIVIPNVTWKVVLVMPNGADDLRRVSRSTRAFGVIMSNVSISQFSPWRNYRVTVDQVEQLTGHNFFSEIPNNFQELIERRRDTQ
ncbi:MAG: DNA/RNA non-specific endonuclease [Pyrinomonadaceae bacterium]